MMQKFRNRRFHTKMCAKTQNRTSLIQPGDLNDEQNCSCVKNNHLFKNLSFIEGHNVVIIGQSQTAGVIYSISTKLSPCYAYYRENDTQL